MGGDLVARSARAWLVVDAGKCRERHMGGSLTMRDGNACNSLDIDHIDGRRGLFPSWSLTGSSVSTSVLVGDGEGWLSGNLTDVIIDAMRRAKSMLREGA